uniref:non-specific serine/threonine protein kinase n=1 Tax=Ciona savignyi TaxID=51511 RepID=H2Y8T9_CIOSA
MHEDNKLTETQDSLEQSPADTAPYSKLITSLTCPTGRIRWESSHGKRIGFYSLRGELGSGNFSKVKAAIHMLTKERVAIKVLDKQKMDKKTKLLLSREISNMEMLHHPNVIRLYEVIHTEIKLYLVLEYANGGELFTKLSTQGKLTERDSKLIFAQILSAVQHMHQHKIIHRDLKAENIFYSEKRRIKVGDFGFSTEEKSMDEALNTFCGSPPYAAPELFRDAFYYGESVDIWALGVLLYFSVTGTMPFRAETVGKLKKKIISCHFTMPGHVSAECRALIRGILKPFSSERMSISEIKNAQWLADVEYPVAMNYYRLEPAEVVPEHAKPEEAYAMQCLAKLGIRPNHVRKLRESRNLTKGAGGYLLERSHSAEHFSCLNEHGAVVGTYRILLRRAHYNLATAHGGSSSCPLCGAKDVRANGKVLETFENKNKVLDENKVQTIKGSSPPSLNYSHKRKNTKSRFCLIL